MKKIISIFMVCTMMIISCIVPASATTYNEPLEVGIRGIIAYPCDMSQGKFYNDYPTKIIAPTYRGMGILNLTLNEKATQQFHEKNCDSFFAEIYFYWKGADRYELYCNDEIVDQGYCTKPNGDYTSIPIPYSKYNSAMNSRYKIVVYNRSNRTAIAWGHIYLDESVN